MTSDRPVLVELQDAYVLRGHVAALRGLSLTISGGERLVLRGPSGSGKSTLVSVIAADLAVSAGAAHVLGTDTSNLSTSERRRLQSSGMGLVNQRTALDLFTELTCLENVALQSRIVGHGSAEAKRSALEMMDRFGVLGVAERRPRTLSGGERQRVALAAALAHRPKIIVLDEPTGELDAQSAAAVYDTLADTASEIDSALVLVTHDARAEHIATRVISMEDGRFSTERVRDHQATLVVDRQGWVWLPAQDRATAGIGTRAVGHAVAGQLTLHGTGDDQAAITAPTRTPFAGSRLSVVDASDLVVPVGPDRRLGPLSFAVHNGQLAVLTGRSGTGKTSVLSALLNPTKAIEGSLHVVRSSDIACMPQTTAFSERQSALENLHLARSLRSEPHADPNPLLTSLGLLELARRPMTELSGGERQRVALARALFTEAPLILVDEPTSQLDRLGAARVLAALFEATAQGRSIVCATHDDLLIEAADVQITLDQ